MDMIGRLRDFVGDFTHLVSRESAEPVLLEEGGALLRGLISRDDWLPDIYAAPHPERYQQYLLHCDPLERFSVVSFVWGPGQRTPLHDHRVWGLIGVLRGGEVETQYGRDAQNRLVAISEQSLHAGDIASVSPSVGDLHLVENAFADRVSVTIQVYGANIGAVRRHVFDAGTSAVKPFVSGYSSPTVPNFWDYSQQVRDMASSEA